MSHHIQVIIGKETIIDTLKNSWVHACKLPLKQGFALIPITDNLLDDITELMNNKKESPFPHFYRLNASLDELLKSESHKRQLGYIETEYFGGSGSQLAILYEDQKVGLGPLKTETSWNQKRMSYETLPEGKASINQVLEKIGVSRIGDKDEFDSIDLRFYRSNTSIVKKCL